MQYSLQFRDPTRTTLSLAQSKEGERKLFPYTALYRYENDFLDLRRLHYCRRSIQLDHFSAKHRENYQIDIVTDSQAYILIALEAEKLTYNSQRMVENSLSFCSNECLLLYAAAGRYSVELGGKHNRFHIVSLDPALLYPLRDEFDELVRFMETTKKAALSSMGTYKMDKTFRYRLQRLTDVPFGRHKDFNRRLLWELPPLLSAYKGLIQGKDRSTREKQLMDDIYQYIDAELKAARNVSVEHLCKSFPVSRRRLERLFSAHQNSNPSSYIRSRKIATMGDLLRSTDIPILELALMFGYSDSQSLNRAFKKEMGISPAQYRLQ